MTLLLCLSVIVGIFVWRLWQCSAELEDGMSVLDLGCGWGSLSLWLVSTYPNMRVTAVSNSATQARVFTICVSQNTGAHTRMSTEAIHRQSSSRGAVEHRFKFGSQKLSQSFQRGFAERLTVITANINTLNFDSTARAVCVRYWRK